MKHYFLNAFFLVSVVPRLVVAVDIGSDLNVDRFSSLQLLNNGDRIAGFAALEAGFKLSNLGVTATFDSFFPVSGTIELGGGTLVLGRDLIFTNEAEFKTNGNIDGNFHVLEIAKTMTSLPTNGFIGATNGSTCDCSITKIEHIATPDDVESVDWAIDGKFVAIGLGTKGSSGPGLLKIYSFNGLALTEEFSGHLESSNAEITSVRWSPVAHPTVSTKYYLAVSRHKISGSKSELLIVEYDSILKTVSVVGSVNIENNVSAIAWHPEGNFLAAGTDKSGGQLVIYPVNTNGSFGAAVTNTPVTIGEKIQTQALGFDATGVYLAVGLKRNSAAELRVYTFDKNTPSLNVTATATKEINKDVRALDWNGTYQDVLVIGCGNPSNVDDIVIVYKHDPTQGTPDARLIKKFGIDDDVFAEKYIRSLHWASGGDCLALGKNPSDGERVSDGHTDSGTEFRIYSFDSTTYVLTDLELGSNVDDGFSFPNSVESVRWSRDGCYIVNGSDRRSGDSIPTSRLSLYSRDCTDCGVPADGCFTWSDICVYLNCNLTWKDCCITFSGTSVINGRGNCLILDDCADIRVDQNSSLKFKDICVKGLDGTQIRGLADSSKITFENAELILDGDYTFSIGSFNVERNVIISGQCHTFAYQSNQVSTVDAESSLVLDDGITFSYDPPIANRELFKLATNSSELFLNSATLHSTSTGLRLTVGKLTVDGRSWISSEATVKSEAIAFGDGVINTNNLCIHWLPAANLELKQGFVTYDNV